VIHGGARNSKRSLSRRGCVRPCFAFFFVRDKRDVKSLSPRRPLKRVIQWANTNRRLDNTESTCNRTNSLIKCGEMIAPRGLDRSIRTMYSQPDRCARLHDGAPLPSHPSNYDNTGDSWGEGDRVFGCNNFGWASDPASRPPIPPPSPASVSLRAGLRSWKSPRARSFNPLTRRRWG